MKTFLRINISLDLLQVAHLLYTAREVRLRNRGVSDLCHIRSAPNALIPLKTIMTDMWICGYGFKER